MNETDMVALGDPVAGDWGRYRVLPGFGGTALFDADFHNFSFEPHFHDTLMLGLILEGEKRFMRRRGANHVGVGGISVVNPGDLHTGGVVRSGARLRYAAVYPSAELSAEAGLAEGADFRAAVVEDAFVGALFARALSAGAAAEDMEEALLIALAALGARHGDRHGGRRGAAGRREASCTRAVARAIERIEAEIDAPLSLETLASTAGVGARHLIRSFQGALGITPRQYVRQARVRRAAALLRRGDGVGAAAAAVGFADQPHLTRVFRAMMGVTPAAYARSWRAAA